MNRMMRVTMMSSDPSKNLVQINFFVLLLLCAGCICVTVLIALPNMVERSVDASARLELQKVGDKPK
jgi:hypothetical protein